ncbi:hypothetical protein [Limibacterium fermenti]|uniref:DUF6874 family protein n=1 Tax=Limibacterium fermenti TaxID=3229863 RepID=UPI000E9D0C7C|nr:hypothetical protein [Porphyromonadaceae bacterium]
MGIKWQTSKEDGELISRISDRASSLDLTNDQIEVQMDITAVHLNDVELDLRRLLEEFDDFNFAHDINGIRRHIDTETGKLTGGFLPRCTKKNNL